MHELLHSNACKKGFFEFVTVLVFFKGVLVKQDLNKVHSVLVCWIIFCLYYYFCLFKSTNCNFLLNLCYIIMLCLDKIVDNYWKKKLLVSNLFDLTYETHHEKISFRVSDQVRHKRGCIDSHR